MIGKHVNSLAAGAELRYSESVGGMRAAIEPIVAEVVQHAERQPADVEKSAGQFRH
jgi:hypothetical protein